MTTGSNIQNADQIGAITGALAALCHNCGICAYANRKKGFAFERIMRWHRNWCPAWKAHARVYGLKALD